MVVKAIKVKKIYILIIVIIAITISFTVIKQLTKTIQTNSDTVVEEDEEKKYIKWVDYNVPLEVMEKTAKLDINSHNKDENVKLNWIELISCLATKYGGNFKSFKQSDLDSLVEKLKQGEKIENIVSNHKLYDYYIEAYTAILDEFIGEYEIQEFENNEKVFKKKYGIKAFLPVAKNYGFSHYDDFGNSRSYGYKRIHLGNDLMGQIGTPIVAVESGIVEACRLEPIWRVESRNKKL